MIDLISLNFNNVQQVEGRILTPRRKKEFPPQPHIHNQNNMGLNDMVAAIKGANTTDTSKINNDKECENTKNDVQTEKPKSKEELQAELKAAEEKLRRTMNNIDSIKMLFEAYNILYGKAGDKYIMPSSLEQLKIDLDRQQNKVKEIEAKIRRIEKEIEELKKRGEQ